ncbi:MAG: two-component system nitrogen regulation sensor histidine kinase NtrY, partial [Arenicella sp.]
MTLRAKYIIYILLVHAVIIGLSFQFFESDKLYFILSELVALVSLIVAFSLLHDFYAPIKMILSGTDAIKDKDFNIKYVQRGKLEIDRLINAYNLMIDELREERTKQQEQHYFLEKLINASPIGILLLDLDGNISQVNPKICSLLGLNKSELLKQKFPIPNSPLAQKITEIELGKSANITLEGFRTYRCQKSHFLNKGFLHTFIMLEELTAERLQIEKEAYGQVIRMMAHEVNNTIGPVNSILDSVNRFLGKADLKADSYSEALQVAQDRNGRLSQFMNNFADVVRLPKPHIQSENMQETLQDIHTLMQSQAQKKGLEFEIQLPEKPVFWQIDRQQFEQALVNIIKNAFEASYENGKIEISLSNQNLVIRNNGKPIPKELETQIFSPFFSNKTLGQGIGLTLTKEILLNHNFEFSLSTKESSWTEFEI